MTDITEALMIADKNQPNQRVFWDGKGWNPDILSSFKTRSIAVCNEEITRIALSGLEGQVVTVIYEEDRDSQGPFTRLLDVIEMVDQ